MKKSAVCSLKTRNKYSFRNQLSTFHVFRKYLLSGHQSIQLFTMWTHKYDKFKGEI